MMTIALHRPGAIGDILMGLNVVPELHKRFPDAIIHYFCHPSYGEALSPILRDAGVSDWKSSLDFNKVWMTYTMVRNLVGYPQNGPMVKHLINYFALDMGLSEFKILPSLEVRSLPRIAVPQAPYITLHPKAGWSMYKNFDRWDEVIKHLDLPVYQIGQGNEPVVSGANPEYMGRSLCEAMALMSHATCHLGVDSFSNHVTHFSFQGRKIPSVILWGSTQISASGYDHNINISANLPCQPCFREDPKISADPRGMCPNPAGQTYENPRHACMAAISTQSVIEATKNLLSRLKF